MKFKEFATQLGIEKEGVEKNGKYIIELEDSNEFSKIYSLFENSELLELEPDLVLVSTHTGYFIYNGEEYEVRLLSNFDNDDYHIVIIPLEENDTQEEQEK